jgi:hypothetical protein
MCSDCGVAVFLSAEKQIARLIFKKGEKGLAGILFPCRMRPSLRDKDEEKSQPSRRFEF